MRDIIKKVPLPITGLILGLAALGNLLQSYSETLRWVCGGIAAGLLVLFLLKCILYPAKIREDLANPIMASVAATFPMALMLLSVYAKPFLGLVSLYIWLAAIALHLALIVYFTWKFIFKLALPKVFASYFIVYAGIAVASVSAPAYEKQVLGAALFWLAFAGLLPMLAVVTLRYAKLRTIPDPAKPLICVYAAPVSLCVAGYVQSVTPKAFGFLMAMYAVSAAFYLFSLVKAAGFLGLPFFPSYSAFTFPFVISAIASKQTMALAANLGSPLPVLKPLVLIQTAVAAAFVLYTLVRYLGFLLAGSKAEQKQ